MSWTLGCGFNYLFTRAYQLIHLHTLVKRPLSYAVESRLGTWGGGLKIELFLIWPLSKLIYISMHSYISSHKNKLENRGMENWKRSPTVSLEQL